MNNQMKKRIDNTINLLCQNSYNAMVHTDILKDYKANEVIIDTTLYHRDYMTRPLKYLSTDSVDNGLLKFKDAKQDKNMLISVLANISNLDFIKTNLTTLSKDIIAIDITKSWHVQLYTQKFTPFVLIDVLLTNNNSPKIVALGLDCCRSILNYLNDHDSPLELNGWFNLVRPIALWNTDSPSKNYRNQLITLESDFDWDAAMKMIDISFKKALHNELKTKYSFNSLTFDMKHYLVFDDNDEDDTTNHVPSIKSLDLAWFIRELPNYQIRQCAKDDDLSMTSFQHENITRDLFKHIATYLS